MLAVWRFYRRTLFIFFICVYPRLIDLCISQFRMTEFGTLEMVTDPEVKEQEAEASTATLDPAPSHSPTPPPEGKSDTVTAPANQTQAGSSKGRQMTAS